MRQFDCEICNSLIIEEKISRLVDNNFKLKDMKTRLKERVTLEIDLAKEDVRQISDYKILAIMADVLDGISTDLRSEALSLKRLSYGEQKQEKR